jgi:hypothetical protein
MNAASGDERGTTERVLTLLGLLQQRQIWTGPELAARLGVTRYGVTSSGCARSAIRCTAMSRRTEEGLRVPDSPVPSSH